MLKGNHKKAFESLAVLRYTKVQAARDVFYMHTLLEAEREIKSGRNRVVEMFTIGRNRRGMVGSEIVMFMQQVSSSNTYSRLLLAFLPSLHTLLSLSLIIL